MPKQLLDYKIDGWLGYVSKLEAAYDGCLQLHIRTVSIFKNFNKDLLPDGTHVDHSLAYGVFVDATILQATNQGLDHQLIWRSNHCTESNAC